MARYNGRTCIALNCKSGYKSDCSEKKLHFFSVPAGKDILEKWQHAISRENFVIRTGQVVCEKHFLPEDILWKREVKGPDGKVMASVDYKVPRLKKGVVPSIFSKNLPKVEKKSRPLIKRKLLDLDNLSKTRTKEIVNEEKNSTDDLENSSPNIKENESIDIDAEECVLFTDEPVPSISSLKSSEQSETKRLNFFNSLISSKNSFKLPTSWARYDIENGEFRAIEFSECRGQWKDGRVTTVHHKKIILYKDMTMHVLVMNCTLDKKVLGVTNSYVTCVEEIESAIDILHKLEVCQGCASSFVRNSNRTFMFRDCIGTLRHNNCSLILDSSTKPQWKLCHSCILSKEILKVYNDKKICNG